jgi:hypothetical protein
MDSGNAMSGLRAVVLPRDARLVAAGRLLQRAVTFSDQPSRVFGVKLLCDGKDDGMVFFSAPCTLLPCA